MLAALDNTGKDRFYTLPIYNLMCLLVCVCYDSYQAHYWSESEGLVALKSQRSQKHNRAFCSGSCLITVVKHTEPA